MPTTPKPSPRSIRAIRAGIERRWLAAVDYDLAAPKVAVSLPSDRHERASCCTVAGQSRQSTVFEPRKSDDVNAFGDRKAVYAASDGLWPMYFAILDRDRYPMSLINSSVRLDLGDGRRSEPYYFFSITDKALAQRPLSPGHDPTSCRATRSNSSSPNATGNGISTCRNGQASLPVIRPIAGLPVGRPGGFSACSTGCAATTTKSDIRPRPGQSRRFPVGVTRTKARSNR